MKCLFRTTTLLLALAPFVAHADTFEFNYTFANGVVVSGNFSAATPGLSFWVTEDFSDISVAVDGVSFSGELYAFGMEPPAFLSWAAYPYGDPYVGYFSNESTFIFGNTSCFGCSNHNSSSNYFSLSSGLASVLTPTGLFHQENASLGNWSLVNTTVTAPIPEPETYAMLLAGLGLLGFEARRQKKLQRAA